MSNHYPGVYKYKHLPILAHFILDEHIQTFAVEQLQLARQYNIPLLNFLRHLSDEAIIDIALTSLREILWYLVNNNAEEQISVSTERWLTNQLQVVGKYDIAAEDITLINHVRGKSLKSFAFKLYEDRLQLHELLDEIDDFILASTTVSANTYIAILKDQLRQQEEFRSKLSKAVPGFMYVRNVPNKMETFSNGKLAELLGYSTQELKRLSNNFYQAITNPDDWAKSEDCRTTFSDGTGSICSFESRVKDASGAYKWLRYYETILRKGPAGTIEEVVGVAFDVTGEKEISEALAIREAQLLEAQSIAYIGSFEWYIAGNKSTTNTPEIYRIFEMEQMEKFEQFIQHVHRDDVQKVQEAMRQSFQTGIYECVYRYLRNQKEKIIWSKGVVTMENGKPFKMVGTVQDITTIKRIEEELKRKTIQLEKSNENLQQFAAIASHDLKEPLRKISIYASRVLQLEKDKLAEMSYTALNKISDSTWRLQRMVDDILTFSFIDAEQQKTEADLEEILREVKDLLSEQIIAKKAEIISDGLPLARVIVSQMRQLFQNLLANALKFCREGEAPRITITHNYVVDKPTPSVINQNLEICIADNGIGFDDSNSEKIFHTFHRLHSKNEFEGTGLGLSVCRKIVDNHGGTIKAKSKLGEGATFVIQLPQ
ncbi:PAS domain-containing sensor histidine kinase [Flavitalea antarctica]